MPDATEPQTPSQDGRAVQRRWLEPLLASLGLALVLAVVFGPLVLDPHAAGKYDVYRAFGPWSYFFDRSIQGGDFPEWNPLTFGGAPFAANPQTWALYPPNVVRALLHSQPTPRGTMAGLAALAFLHLVVLGLGTYRLARAHALSVSAAALAALGASLNALVVRRAAELHFLFTLAWLPWILLHTRAFLRAETPRERLHQGAWLAGYVALAVLGGFPQLYPYLLAGVLAYAVAERLSDPRWRAAAGQAHARLLGRLLGQDLLYAVPVVLLALGLAACLLLPAQEFAELSARVSGLKREADGHAPEQWTLTYVWRALAVYSGQRYEPESLRGAGIGLLALASAGVIGALRRERASLLAGLYVFVDLLIGPPMPIASLLALASPFQMVSATRAADVGLIFFALVAAAGLDALRSELTWQRALAAVTALGVGGAAVYTLRHQLIHDRVWAVPSLAVLFVPAVLLAAVLLAAVAAQTARSPAWLARALPPLCVLLIACELVAWNGPYAHKLIVQRGFTKEWLSKTDVEGKNPFWPDNRRVTDERPNFGLFTLRGLINGYDPLHLDKVRRFLASKNRSRRYERTVSAEETTARNARGNLWMKRAFWLVPSVVVGEPPARMTLYPPTEVAFVSKRLKRVPAVPREAVLGRAVSIDATRTELDLPKLRVMPAREGKKRGRLATDRLSLPPQHAALEVVVRARGKVAIAPTIERTLPEPFQPREMVALEVEGTSEELREHRFQIPLPDVTALRAVLDLTWDDPEQAPELLSLAVLSDRRDEDAKLEVVQRNADEVRVRVTDLPAPRLLAFSDAYYPGWHVEVDGKPARMIRTFDVFKGVELTAGSHDVRFYFRSARLHLGLWIGVVALVAGAALLWLTRRRPSSA